MESELIMGYIVYVDGTATKVGRSLDEAKRLGEEFMFKKCSLRIESAVAPAPTRVWNYDYNVPDWVERI